MAESMHLDSTDIVSTLDELESLETIQAELDLLNEQQEVKTESYQGMSSNEMVLVPSIVKEEDDDLSQIKEEEMRVDNVAVENEEADDDDDGGGGREEEDEEGVQHVGAEDGEVEHVTESVYHHQEDDEVIEGMTIDDEAEIVPSTMIQSDGIDDMMGIAMEGVEMDDDGNVIAATDDVFFSEGIIDEQIIDSGQVIEDMSAEQIPEDQILEEKAGDFIDDFMGPNDVTEETIIEATEVEDIKSEELREGSGMMEESGHEDDDDVKLVVEESADQQQSIDAFMSQAVNEVVLPDGLSSGEIITADLPSSVFKDDKSKSAAISQLAKPVIQIPSSSTAAVVQDTIKQIASGLYVVSSSGAVTAMPATTQQCLISTVPKDQPQQKIARLVSLSGSSMTTTSPTPSSAQTIRIVAPPGKMNLNATAKTITLAQARQMGLIATTAPPKIVPGVNSVATARVVQTKSTSGALSKILVPSSKKTVTIVKSPAKILPAPSPSAVQSQQQQQQQQQAQPKYVIRQGQTTGSKPRTTIFAPTVSSGGNTLAVVRMATASGGTQQLQLAGSGKPVQYVKLVSTPAAGTTGSGANKSQTINLSKAIPLGLSGSIINSQGGSFKVVPISSTTGGSSGSITQRVLIPASAVSGGAGSGQNLVVLPSTLQPSLAKISGQDNRIVTTKSASVVNGRSSVTFKAAEATGVATPSSVNPLTSNAFSSSTAPTTTLSASAINKVEPKGSESWSGDEASILEANGIRPRKPCNCTKSMCLKLYCDCFANGEFCNQCNCTCCYNNLDHEEERQKAIKACLERNPSAFRPKIGKTLTGSDERRHHRGCNCKRSGCLKNYCECYEAKIPCSRNCKCMGCKNTEGFSCKRGLYDEDRRYRLDRGYDHSSPSVRNSLVCRQAFNMMTPEIIQATCRCLLAQTDEWEKTVKDPEDPDAIDECKKLIVEEFGRCFAQIIEVVTKNMSQQQSSSAAS